MTDMMPGLCATLLCSAIFCLGCATSAEKRIAQYFGVPEDGIASTNSIRAAVLEKIPTGSTAESIYAYFESLDIGEYFAERTPGQEPYTGYIRAREHPRYRDAYIRLHIELAPRLSKRVYREYTILFKMGEDGRLVDVEAHYGLTGP